VLSMVIRLGGSCSVTSQVYSTPRRPLERIRVRTVLPTPIGSAEVSSSVSTLSSHWGR
jgi:hypothetical protein